MIEKTTASKDEGQSPALQVLVVCEDPQLGQTADTAAAQQVVTSLSFLAASSGCKKSYRFCFGRGVFFPSQDLANPVGIGSEFVNDIGVRRTLNVHHVDCNSLRECQRSAFECDNVHFDTGDWVSFCWGLFPEQVCHGNTPFLAEEAKDPARSIVSWCCTFNEGAVTSAGVATANRRPGSAIIPGPPVGAKLGKVALGGIDEFLTVGFALAALPAVSRIGRAAKGALSSRCAPEGQARLEHAPVIPPCPTGARGCECGGAPHFLAEVRHAA